MWESLLGLLPLFVLWVLAANDVHVFPTLPPHTFAALAKLLHATPDLHPSGLLASNGFGRIQSQCLKCIDD